MAKSAGRAQVVTEALAPDGTQFSAGRLESCLRGLGGCPAARLVEASVAAVRDFAATAPQSDDISVMVVRYRRHFTALLRQGIRVATAAEFTAELAG